jgi:hypothetical protein
MRVGADAGEFPDSQAHRNDLFSRAFASFRVYGFQDRRGDAYSCKACPPADARQLVSREQYHRTGHRGASKCELHLVPRDRRYAHFPNLRADALTGLFRAHFRQTKNAFGIERCKFFLQTKTAERNRTNPAPFAVGSLKHARHGFARRPVALGFRGACVLVLHFHVAWLADSNP